MAGGGNYPLMSEIEWENAPWNQKDVEYEVCPECNGSGYIYLNENGKQISQEEYEEMDESVKENCCRSVCELCDGYGEIPYEDMIDYDDFD